MNVKNGVKKTPKLRCNTSVDEETSIVMRIIDQRKLKLLLLFFLNRVFFKLNNEKKY